MLDQVKLKKTIKLTRRSRSTQMEFLSGAGEMKQLIRTFDWANHPLGPISGWPLSLQTALGICLNSRFPMLVWWGEDLRIIYNDAWRPVLGKTKHPQALGSPGREVFPEVWDIVGAQFASVKATGQATWSDDLLLVLDRNGYTEETYFTYSYSPIKELSGELVGIFATVSETTERVLGERRLRLLRELAARTAGARSVSEAGFALARVLCAGDLDISFALLYLIKPGQQARLLQAVGIEPETVASPVWVDLAQADPWQLGRVAATNEIVVLTDLPERFGPLPGGAWSEPTHTALVLPVAKPGQAEATGLLVVGVSPQRAFDETYRGFFELVAGQVATAIANAQTYEEERTRAEQLAELDRAKTTFFSNVSHEFRTPLTLMLGPLEDILRQPLPPELDESLTLVQRNGLRLLKLVNTLLDFSRIEAGRIQASYEPLDLAQFTAELASVFRAAVEKAGLALVVHCPPLAEPVWVDRDLWEKIVLNLLSNALKFTFTGEIVVSVTAEPAGVVLGVRDTGTGIPAAELPHIFKRFHRVAGARGRTHEGSGIGLALVEELVKLHGGTVMVQSVLGVGTQFELVLPSGSAHLPQDKLRAAQSKAPQLTALPYVAEALRWLPEDEPLPEVVPTQATAQILLVDDNSDMRDYVGRLLNQHYTVTTASDGVAALELIQAQRPDLILSDVMMPQLDGFGLLARLRDDPTTREIPVILLSARAGEEAKVEGLTQGADDYLVKPFSARELLARVRTHLELARVRQSVIQTQREAQEQVTSILDSISDGFIALDRDWRYIYVNPEAVQQCRLNNSEQLLGRVVWEVFPEAIGSLFYTEYHRAMDQQVPVSFESYYPPFDTWYEVHAYPAPTVLSVYFQDVTERKRNETLLQQVAAGTAQATGEDFFPAFVRYLATTLGVRYAFVTELITPLRVRVIAFWQGDYWGEPFEYDLVETPCKRVIEEGGEYFCPDRVQEVFPRDRDLAQLEAVSYLGMPLWDLSGHIVGHISVLDDKPMTVAEQGRAVFNIFAERAQAEFERKRTQEALQQSEDRYRTFIAQSSEGIWRIEVDCPIPVQTPVEQQLDYFYAHGYLAECNQAMAQMYGFDESEQMVGARLGDLLPRTDERNLSYLRAFIESGYRLTDTESYEVDRTGQPKYFLNNLVGIIEDGYLVRSWGSQRDVTETRRLEAEQQAAEAQLQEATRRAATILDSITEAFYALDHEWRYTHVNQQCEAYYGKTRAELLGRVVWEVFPMAAGSPFEVQYRRAIQEQVAVHFEVLSPFSHRWLEIHAYPSTAGLSVYFRDITNRKQAEKDLNKAVQELTFHMENSPLGVVEWGADFRVARWSPQAEQIFGWSAQEVSGLHPTAWEFVHVDDRPMVAVAMERLLTGGDERGVSPNRNYTKTGQVLHCVWYNSALLDEEGQLVSVLSLVQDVTAQHLARAEREQLLQREQAAREQAQQANRLKDEFLAVVSHELRTPLNAMLGWTQLLRRGNLSAEANQRALETIERNGRAQNELIADILDVSRIIAGKLTLNTVPVQLNTVIQSALESVQLAAEAKGITLVTILNENCEVLGDINRLRQIVWNLLTNAIKFTPNDGQVVVCLDQANQAVLTISDTGMGIDPIFLPHIFERFRQADSTTTRQFGGLGLGLAIVRHLVELHGGTVFAQSAGLSLGATFTVTLPLVAACPQRAISLLSPAPCREEALLTGLKVLVVDDEDDQRELTALILETEGAEVRVAASVQLALVTLGQWNPDVLVSDIAMPGADGYALLRQLAAQGSTIPAVALTAQARAEDRRQSLAQGYRYHLSKPVEAQQLVTIIAELGGKITILRD